MSGDNQLTKKKPSAVALGSRCQGGAYSLLAMRTLLERSAFARGLNESGRRPTRFCIRLQSVAADPSVGEKAEVSDGRSRGKH